MKVARESENAGKVHPRPLDSTLRKMDTADRGDDRGRPIIFEGQRGFYSTPTDSSMQMRPERGPRWP